MNEPCFKQENFLSKTEATFISFRAVDLEIGSKRAGSLAHSI